MEGIVEIKYFGEADDIKWGVYQIECVLCGAEWVAVAPIYTEFDCHHCGSAELLFDTTDNRFCSPPEEIVSPDN